MRSRFLVHWLLLVIMSLVIAPQAVPVAAQGGCPPTDLRIRLDGEPPPWMIISLSGESEVVLTVLRGEEAIYDNLVGLASPEDKDLYYSKRVNEGDQFYLGKFAAGTELVFRITTPEGKTYFTGPGERNPDGLVHANVQQISNQTFWVGWEDLFEGGDKDYDDVFFQVCGDFKTSVKCEVPEGAKPVPEIIYGFPGCGGDGPRGLLQARWGRFGNEPQTELRSNAGEKLELECKDGVIPSYVLYYTTPSGQRYPVGGCPFEGGCNTAWFFHSGNKNNDDKPDCFITTRWVSRDYGEYDDDYGPLGIDRHYQNSWTKDWTEDPKLLDWADSIFNTVSQEFSDPYLVKFSYKYNYNLSHPLQCGEPIKPEGDMARITQEDPPLGSEVIAFFDGVFEILQTHEPGAPMEGSPFELCDFNSDGSCNVADYQIFRGAFGACRGDADYHPIADFDGDGCATFTDQDYLFTVNPVNIDIKPGSDPNSINCNSEREVITVAILSTEDFDAATVDHTTVAFEGASEIHVNWKTGEPQRHEEDVDGDGDIDLVVHFKLGDTNLACDFLEGSLIGETFDGQIVSGVDSIRMIVP